MPTTSPESSVLWRDTLEVNLLGVSSIPMIAFCTPRVIQNDPQAARLVIPLARRTKNHLGSMYFGALAVGADLAGGLTALRLMRERGVRPQLAFKDLKAEFLKRADGDVEFECLDAAAVEQGFDETVRSGERVNIPLRITARVRSRGDEPVARFDLTLSLRYKASAEKSPLWKRALGLASV